MAIVIHTIKGHQYEYEHHRVGDKIISDYIGPVGTNKRKVTQHKEMSDFGKRIHNSKIDDDKLKAMNKARKFTPESLTIGAFKDGKLLKDGFNNQYDANNYLSKQLNYNEDAKFSKGLSYKQLGYTTKVTHNEPKISNLAELRKIESDYNKQKL